MKNFYSFLALLVLCTAGATFAGDAQYPWRTPNLTIKSHGMDASVTIIVDNLKNDVTGELLAVGTLNYPDGSRYWKAFTQKEIINYEPSTNTYGASIATRYQDTSELVEELRSLAIDTFVPQQSAPHPASQGSASAHPASQPIQQNQKSAETEQPNNPADPDKKTENPDDQQNQQQSNQPDGSNNDDTPKSEDLITSTLDFLTGKPFLVTISASTCAAVAAFYAADWYNSEFIKGKTEKKIDRRYAAAIVGMSTAVICSGYFYYTATPSLQV